MPDEAAYLAGLQNAFSMYIEGVSGLGELVDQVVNERALFDDERWHSEVHLRLETFKTVAADIREMQAPDSAASIHAATVAAFEMVARLEQQFADSLDESDYIAFLESGVAMGSVLPELDYVVGEIGSFCE